MPAISVTQIQQEIWLKRASLLIDNLNDLLIANNVDVLVLFCEVLVSSGKNEKLPIAYFRNLYLKSMGTISFK